MVIFDELDELKNEHVALIETSPFQKFICKCRLTGELTRISLKIDSTR